MITSGGGRIDVTGTGGSGGANENYGVIVNSSGQISATGFANLNVTGNAGGGRFFSSGVALWGGGKILSESGFAEIKGTGANATNPGSTSFGVLVDGSGSRIGVTDGNLLVDGTGGTADGSSYGVLANFSGVISASGTSVLTIDGTSGSAGDISYGVALFNDADVLGGDSTVFVTGTSGSVTRSNGTGSGIALHAGTVINSTGGNVSVTGNGGTGGITNHGVTLFNNGLITAGGTGSVSVTGFGGENRGTLGLNESSAGVAILANGSITSNSGAVTVTGTGGDANGVRAFSYGVRLADTGATITSGGGNVSVTGTGGAVGLESYGVSLVRALITSGGSGSVLVEGTGGSGLQYNEGVSLYSNASITSGGGAVTVIDRAARAIPSPTIMAAPESGYTTLERASPRVAAIWSSLAPQESAIRQLRHLDLGRWADHRLDRHSLRDRHRRQRFPPLRTQPRHPHRGARIPHHRIRRQHDRDRDRWQRRQCVSRSSPP